MFKFIQNKIAERKADNDLVDMLLKDWKENPNDWDISSCRMSKWQIDIWIANSPHGDMKMQGRRLPRRWELRRALVMCGIAQANYLLSKNK